MTICVFGFVFDARRGAITRNKPVFFQHVVEKKRTRMLEKYRIWQKPVIDKKMEKSVLTKNNGNMVFQVCICTHDTESLRPPTKSSNALFQARD